MKKVLSLVMMLMLAIGAWAGEVTDVLTGAATGVTGSSYTEWSGVTLNSEAVYAGQSAGSNNSIQLRSKNNNSGVITTASGGTVKSVTVVFESHTMDGRTLNVYGKNSAYSAATDLYDSSLQGELLGSFVKGEETSSLTINGDYEYIAFRSAADAMYIESITIVWETEGETPVTVATPEITGETPFTESTEVSITCATEGASIYYTLDGATPTNASTEYSGAFELTETTTVKAIAYDANNNASSVATKEFVKEEPVVLTNVATVAEFNALADGTDFIFTGNLVATGQTGKYLYAQDSDNGILIYGTIDQTYSDLAEIPGGWTGKKTTFNGAPEAAEPAGLAAATEHVDLAPEEMTPAQVTLENAFKYVVIRGATVTMTNNNNGTITVGDETVALYKRFNVTIPTDDGVYDIIGITGYYNAPQFMPLEFVAQGVDVATPVIEGETPFVGSTTVTITCATEGASIYYTTDGTEPTNQSTAYTAPFELTESATVKAIAYDANNNASVVASKEFVKTPSISTAAEYNALPENTTFVFNGNLVVSGQKNKYLYAQDATGGVLIYGTAPTYSKGDVIPAGFTAKKINYNGTIEMSEMTGMQAATETAELVAQELAINQFADNQNIYAVVKGATVEGNTLSIGEETLAIYNRFGITFPTDDKTYDVYGVATIYNNAPQLLPIEFVEVVEKTASPVITVEEGDEYYVVTAIGDGEVKLYIDEMEVENPYVVVRTSEEQVFTFVATAQEEGKEVSDPTMLTIIVPKLEVVENTITFEAEQEGGTLAVALADGTPVESGVTKVAAGEKVTITATPADGYKLSNIVVKCGDQVVEFDTEVTPGRAAETRTFTMPEGEVSIEATFEEETPTGIENLSMENVKSVCYYNAAGVESTTPFKGVNIVVRVMNDGTKNVIKVVK